MYTGKLGKKVESEEEEDDEGNDREQCKRASLQASGWGEEAEVSNAEIVTFDEQKEMGGK